LLKGDIMRSSTYLAALIASRCFATTCLTTICLSTTANAADYSSTVFFGDSLSDAGTYAALVQPTFPGTGKFTTNPGLVWSEDLAKALGTEATPAVNGGSNYAAGGARVSKNPGYPSTTGFIAAAPAIETQISSYLANNGGRADHNALYSVWAGANDLFAYRDANAASVYAADPMPQVAAQLATQIGGLKNAGARHVIVFNLPDIGATPGALADGPAAVAESTQLSQTYNHELFTQLSAQGISVIPIDTFNLLRLIVANPTRFGFTDVTTPACTGVASSLICNASNYAAGSNQNHLFADDVHPSTATHAALAEYVLGVLAAPQQIAALATSTVATRAALHDLLRSQLSAGALQRQQDGRHFWVAAQGQAIDQDSSALNPSGDISAYHFALGIDVPLSEQVVVGAALSVDHSRSDFDADRGDFSQRDTALSIYGSWRAQPWFVNGALSYGALSYNTERRTPLGISEFVADGSTRGRNLSLQLEGGYDFTIGSWTHGPYLGAVAQEVRIDGFEERDGEVSNLGYAAQRRHSLVGNAGWQVAYHATTWSPYARIGAEHEFENRDHDIALRALSIPEARDFDMPVTDPVRTRYPLQIGVTGELPHLAGYNIGVTHSIDQDSQHRTSFFAAISSQF
jgi:outer membrane lipase/esterase